MEQKSVGPGDAVVAVLYTFASITDGERRTIAPEDLPASKMAMLEPQLAAVPKRSMVDYGPGLLVYDDYQSARYAATTVAAVASRVEIREVTVGGEDGTGWRADSGAWFTPLAGGLSEVVSGEGGA